MSRHMCIAIALILMSCSRNPSSLSGNVADPSQPKPHELKDDWQGLNQTVGQDSQRVWSYRSGSEFGLKDHTAIAEKSSRCSEELVSAQYRQDILKQFDASAHFDNCAFESTLAYIEDELSRADKLLTAPKDPTRAAHKAMSHLGRVLHALQDFYAHSNWVELQYAQEVPFSPASLVVPVWEESGRMRINQTSGLVSGTVWWNGPKRCGKDVPSHEEMNKDGLKSKRGREELSRWERSSYGVALELAEHATGSFLAWAYAKWPVLEQACGNDLYIVQTSDRRPE
ncbi:hypothetical protein JY651_09790 [Pyxidicoccus parkwayensis]|uniref:VWA7 N-terminal domain-containing protein n=1 Tax=Pyxidicoccus parkwayensis TaxID=2813578 RepID=A0ABX7P3Y3_9BACT|nr:HET-C-related protein [Pyxidicoccus parkwaysis]QSQ25193.1 hypothetical protein JY651_09790 [Pyxidicoccus parkwaysis]